MSAYYLLVGATELIEETTKNRGGGARPAEHFVPWWNETATIHHTNKRLSAGRAEGR